MNTKQDLRVRQVTVIFVLLFMILSLVVTTKVIMMVSPGITVEAKASTINKYFFGVMTPFLLLILFKTPMTCRWEALKAGDQKAFRREMLQAAGISAVLIAIMIAARLIMNARNPEIAARPFFGLYLNVHGRWFYPLSVVVQELMIKALMQENIRCLVPNENRHFTAILTGLFFAVLHMNYPLYYLLFAGVLCFGTAYMYERDGNIWGAVLIHFVVGFLPRAFGLKF